jgi:HEAT repeat protein
MLWLSRLQLRSSKAEARRSALERLCARPHPGAIPTLESVLADSDSEVRRLAVAALGKLEDERRIEPLLSALQDRSPEVLKAALEAFKRVSDERVPTAIRPLLRYPDASVRGFAAQVMLGLRWTPASTEEEICLLVANAQCAQAAAFGLAALPALENALEHSPSSLAVSAAQAIGTIGGPQVLRPLLKALKSADPVICIAAINELRNHRNPPVLEPIKNLLRHHTAQVRLAALEAIADLDPGDDIGQVLDLLSDSDWDVRRGAAEVLGRLKNPRSMEALVATLGDSDADVRETAAIALGNLGDRRAIEALVLALADSNSSMRRIAAGSLSRIDPDWASSPEARVAAEQLRSALGDKDADVRHYVNRLLGCGADSAPESRPLSSRLQAPVEDFSAAQHRLAVNLFLEILSDTDRDLRQAAAEALGKLGEPRAKSGLFRACSDPDAGVRVAADLALQSLGGVDD